MTPSAGENQARLFDEPPQWEVDDAQRELTAEVVFAEGPSTVYTYRTPAKLQDRIAAGRRVRAPLGRGNRTVVGYCIGVAERVWQGPTLKDLAAVVDERTLITPDLLELARWMADYYLCPLGKALEAVVPAGVRGQAGTRESTFLAPAPDAARRLGGEKLPAKQAAALNALLAAGKELHPQQLAEIVGCTQAPITALRRKGLVVATLRRIRTSDHAEVEEARTKAHPMLPDQQAALNTITASLRSQQHETFLLHGVTGSGKTEVYIRAIEEVVSYGRAAIVLVPEISLTPQTKQRFRSRFDRVAVLHSHMTDSERHWHWEKIAGGEIDVVVGARSAVFAPTPHLGLIVIDEEHEGTFKQEQAPRYHARETAIERARRRNIPLVLGSATPALESYHAAHSGQYTLLSMPHRVRRQGMPAVRIVDLCTERGKARGAISRPLHQAMHESLRGGGQVILLLNRRGFATHIQCPGCGTALECPHCAIALTHHRSEHLALCHYCDYKTPPPTRCTSCGGDGMYYGGLGTQRLEAEVRAKFPEFPCLRMDADTTRAPGSHERALASFRDRQARILLGTQMIAKGLDFAEVTLVGVVNADTALHLADFRAAERAFQLITQVAGRTGRGEMGGRVLVQTFSPDHPAVAFAARHDYFGFSAKELEQRQELGYPPYAAQIRVVFRGPSDEATETTADAFAAATRAELKRSNAEHRLLGPAPAPVPKLRGRYRRHFLLHGADKTKLRQAVLTADANVKPAKNVEWMIDVEPRDMQ